MAEDRLSRREFAQKSIKVAVSGSLLTLVLEGCKDSSTGPSSTTLTLDLNDARYAALKPVGGAVKVGVQGSLPIIISHTSTSTYLAFTSRCQHQGCEVPLPNAQGVIICPCHGSQYDREGKKLSGPTPRDLPRYTVNVQGEQLIVLL
jgi:Rieske Fe-S protein